MMARANLVPLLVGLALLVPGAIARGLLANQARPAADISDCQACIAAVEAAEALLADPATEELLVEFFDKQVCHALGDLKKCHNLAQGLVPVLIQWIHGSTSPAALCSAAEYCGAPILTNKLYVKRARVADSSECHMCKYVVTHVQAALNNTAVQEQVKEEMLKVCSDLPQELADGCMDFVNTYEPIVTDFINNVEAAKLCSMIGTCMGSLVASRPLPLTPVMAKGLQQLRAVREAAAEASSNGLADACDVCKMAVIEAHSLVANPTVQSDLVNYTKAICEQFQSLSDVCKTYVDQYAPLVFSLLQQYLQPDSLCTELGVCNPPSLLEQLRASLMVHNLNRLARSKAAGLLAPLGLQRVR